MYDFVFLMLSASLLLIHVGENLSVNIHGHQSSSFIAKCNDNKFICGTSHYAAAGFETCR